MGAFIVVVFFSFIFFFVSRRNKLVVLFLFLAKVILTVGVYFIFYYSPLDVGNSLRTSFQNESLYDSNYYDYISAKIASRGLGEGVSLIYSTWNSFGVILYISTIYSLLGVNTVYVVIINVFIVSLGIVRFVESFNILSNRVFLYIVSALFFMPYQIYHDATPSKESLTLGLFLLSLSEYNVSLSSIKNKQNYTSLILLTLVRPMLGALIFVWMQRWALFKSSRSFLYTLAGIILFIFLTPLLLRVDIFQYLSLSSIFDLNDLAQERLSLSGIKLRIFETFGAKDLVSLVVWAPLRLVIWLFLPFPLIEFPIENLFSLNEVNWLLFVQSGQKIFRTLGVLYYLPYLIIFLFSLKSVYKSEMGVFILFIGLLISSYTFINSSRYRLVIEPLIIAQVIIRKYDSKVKSNNFRS